MEETNLTNKYSSEIKTLADAIKAKRMVCRDLNLVQIYMLTPN